MPPIIYNVCVDWHRKTYIKKQDLENMKKILITASMIATSLAVLAQSGTNSPYSQYGLGTLAEQAGGFNRGMNGLGLGFHEHNQINSLNPASYASIDSLSFIFDAGISGQITNYKEGGTKVNAQNGNFEYMVAGFRLAKHLGVSFGILPYTNVGYKYSNTQKIGSSIGSSSSTTYTNTYTGTGGLHQVYLGLGWMPINGLAIGVNGSYLWGNYTRSIVNSYSDNYVNTLSRYYTASVNNYKLDFGVQYTHKLTKKDELTLGLTYSLGHKLGSTPQCKEISNNSQTGVADTTIHKGTSDLAIPTVYGVGLMWNHSGSLKVGLDYTLQKWSSVDCPQYQGMSEHGLAYKDRHKFTLGGEICPQENSRKFFSRVHYRIGASYATDYLKINGQNGPKEYSVSAGFGIPIVNGYNNRSLLNISAQWVRQDCKTFVTENSFRINIGLTFNERWFAKWKME